MWEPQLDGFDVGGWGREDKLVIVVGGSQLVLRKTFGCRLVWPRGARGLETSLLGAGGFVWGGREGKCAT